MGINFVTNIRKLSPTTLVITLSKGVLVPEEEGSKVRPTFWVGKKYLWCAKGSVCEIHGKEKTSWTYLNDHLFKDNSPLEKRS